MNEEEYIKHRLDDQIRWYSNKSQRAKFYFKLFKIIEICAAASIPIIAGFGSDLIPVNFIVALLGGLIAILSAVVSLNQYQERWIEYRNTSEALKHEKFLFLTRAEPYDDQTAFKTFTLRVESLISRENANWTQIAKRPVKTGKVA